MITNTYHYVIILLLYNNVGIILLCDVLRSIIIHAPTISGVMLHPVITL